MGDDDHSVGSVSSETLATVRCWRIFHSHILWFSVLIVRFLPRGRLFLGVE